MGKKLLIASLVVLDIGLLLWIAVHRLTFPMFTPAGIVADKERTLFVGVALFGLVIITTVVITTYIVIWKYREGNTKAVYKPEMTITKPQLIIWWSIPSIIIAILAVVTWQSAHDLDPYKPLSSPVKPMKIQVVALQWKWLFIYPEEHIASVNYVVFPEKTPITFELTADAPMNSFWIPRLGGQIYAMSGMVTDYHLMADKAGEYEGSTAEISGEGFAGMRFTAKATTKEEFTSWVEKIKQLSSRSLTSSTYTILAKPSENEKPSFYASIDDNLYNEIVQKYMPSNHAISDHHSVSEE